LNAAKHVSLSLIKPQLDLMSNKRKFPSTVNRMCCSYYFHINKNCMCCSH